jgi:hypothetical protein
MGTGSARTLITGFAALMFLAACAQNAGYVSGPSSRSLNGQGSDSGRLVVLLVTDNTDHQFPNRQPGSIADGVTKNAELMDTFFRKVRSATGMTVDVRRIAGSNAADDPFTCDNIVQTIKALPVSRGDAVMVYYSGHGFNIGSDDPAITAMQIARYAAPEFRNRKLTGFPFLACGRDVRNTPNLDLIATWLAEKKPRLTIVMSDACNAFEGGSGPAAESFFASGTRALTEDARLRSLFVEARGTVLMTGSQRGHYSYYDTSFFHPGGFFTRAFLSTLDGMPVDQRTSWEQVGAQFTPMIIRVQDRRTSRTTTDVQTPVLRVGEPFATAMP